MRENQWGIHEEFSRSANKLGLQCFKILKKAFVKASNLNLVFIVAIPFISINLEADLERQIKPDILYVGKSYYFDAWKSE